MNTIGPSPNPSPPPITGGATVRLKERWGDPRPVVVEDIGRTSVVLSEPRGGYTVWGAGNLEVVPET